MVIARWAANGAGTWSPRGRPTESAHVPYRIPGLSAGHRIAASPPLGSSRPTPQKTPQNQPATTQRTMLVQRLDCVGGAARRVGTARGQQWTGLCAVVPDGLIQRARRPTARTGRRRVFTNGPRESGRPGQDNEKKGDEPQVGAARAAPEAAVGTHVAAVLLSAAVPAALASPCHLTCPLLRLRHDPTDG